MVLFVSEILSTGIICFESAESINKEGNFINSKLNTAILCFFPIVSQARPPPNQKKGELFSILQLFSSYQIDIFYYGFCHKFIN